MVDEAKELKLFYQNVRGLRTKTNEFYHNLLLLKYDIILITETWLCSGILDAELCDGTYSMFRKDRGSLGGGVMVLCNSHVQARKRPEWDRHDLECVWVTIPARALGSSGDLHIAVIYIPPNSMIPTRVQSFIDVLSIICKNHPNDHFFIAGDFNLPGIDWKSDQPVILKKGSIDVQNSASYLITQTSFFGLTQRNKLVNSRNNTLDLVFTDFPLNITKSSSSLVKEDLYHPALSITANDILVAPFKPRSQIKFQFKRADYDSINDSLNNQDWSFVDNTNDIENIIEKFYSILNGLIIKHVPQISTTGTNNYPVWYSRALIKLIKEKGKAHRIWKLYNNPNDYVDFSELRDRQKKLQTECYKRYITYSQEKIKSHPKFFWSYIKSKRHNNSSYPQQMRYGNKVLNRQEDICEAFNEFFNTNFSEPAKQYSVSAVENNLQMNTIHKIQINRDYILKLIRNIDTSKGAGNDKIPPIFFHKCALSLASPIALVFNKCLRDGYFPKIWKQAHIVPVHKKDQKTVIENYRPISILNVLSKMLERVVHTHIYPVIAPLIPIEQHGFMKGRSTATNLSVFIDNVASGMDGGKQVDVVYTDFEKAFDRVDHIILLRKLYELGIRGSLLRWMESYLRNRSQAVVVGGFCSDFINVSSGVPQGSILGPLLYASYLYDIGSCFQHARFLMYADDTKIYMNVNNQKDCLNLQADLNKMGCYYLENRIGINIKKCQYISFTRKKNIINFEYEISNAKIKKVDLVRDLGVLVDAKLSFSEHIGTVVNKAYKSLGFVLRVSRPFSDISCLKILYCSYVRSVLEYCSMIWSPQYVIYKQNIEDIQRKFIKHLNYRCYHTFNNYSASCFYYNLLTLENRRTLADMTFLHGVCGGRIDCPALSVKILRFSCPKSRTRHTKLFAVPYSRTNYAQNANVARLQRTYNKMFSSIDVFHNSRENFTRELHDILKNT